MKSTKRWMSACSYRTTRDECRDVPHHTLSLIQAFRDDWLRTLISTVVSPAFVEEAVASARDIGLEAMVPLVLAHADWQCALLVFVIPGRTEIKRIVVM